MAGEYRFGWMGFEHRRFVSLAVEYSQDLCSKKKVSVRIVPHVVYLCPR